MKNLVIPPTRVKEIATTIMDGHVCYIGISTAKIQYIKTEPESSKEQAENDKVLALVTKKPDDFLEIGDLPMEDQLECMWNFTDQIKDSKKAKELKNSLRRKKPARNFMQGIDSDIEYSLYWRSHSIAWRTEWVADFILK